MEINRQLFEDVLSGKLKGMFILRGGHKYDISKLRRNTNKRTSNDYPYTIYIGNCVFSCHTINGKNGACLAKEYKYDIIDFLPTKHRDPSYQTQAEIHSEFAQLIEECLKYSEEWSNPLRNDAGGSDQFREIQSKLLEIKKELWK